MLKIVNLLFGIISISIILFSANLYVSVYTQDNQYYYNTNENNNSSLINDLNNISEELLFSFVL